ncbi:MAG: transglutaminase-like domain-containing protein [Rhodospirillaceae bacterium]|nr:transglutaminase-like domain-containing protein [Rhodospirillaceae bacterium]
MASQQLDLALKLREIGKQEDEDINIAEAALLLAAHELLGGVRLTSYRRHLERLVTDVKNYAAGELSDPYLVCEGMQQVLAKRYGYAGTYNVFETDQSANLIHTIDSRRGNGGTLCVIYLHVARELGLVAEVIDFPPRPLIGVTVPNGRIMIDPFEGGQELEAPAMRAIMKDLFGDRTELRPRHLLAIGNRGLLLQLQGEIKHQHLRTAETDAALATIERMLMVAPNEAELWREAGILHSRLDHIDEAISALKHFLDISDLDDHRYQAGQLLQQLYARLDV